MYKNQKKVLISYFLFYGGLFLILSVFLFLFFYTYIYNNKDVNIIIAVTIIVVFLAIFMMKGSEISNPMFRTSAFLVDYKLIEGVPNNHRSQFNLNVNELLKMKQIVFFENKKGIFSCMETNMKIIFDMRLWMRKKYYIYEYILTCIQLECASRMHDKTLIKNVECLSIVFVNIKGKKQELKLIDNHYTNLTFRYKYRIIKKLKLNNGNQNKITDFYELNN